MACIPPPPSTLRLIVILTLYSTHLLPSSHIITCHLISADLCVVLTVFIETCLGYCMDQLALLSQLIWNIRKLFHRLFVYSLLYSVHTGLLNINSYCPYFPVSAFTPVSITSLLPSPSSTLSYDTADFGPWIP